MNLKDRTLPIAESVEAGTPRKKSLIREYAESIIIALILAFTIRAFVVQAFEIPSSSMEDTLAIGDRILVNKFLFGTKIPLTDIRILPVRAPKPGDVIVFEFPEDPSKDFIKRVVGTPGDRIQVVDKQVYVNGKPYLNPHEVHKDAVIYPAAHGHRDNTDVITVPADSYFVMGDNRDNSYDSRFWGFVTRGKIKGQAFMKYWSWDSDNWRVRWTSIGKLIE